MFAASPFISSHYGVLLYNVLQVLNIIGGGKGERDSPMPYSKFAMKAASGSETKMVPSRLGMLIIYLPSLIVAGAMLFVAPQFNTQIKTTMAGYMCLGHFAKRNLETLFLHKYSGKVEISTARLIGFFYALTTFMICLLSVAETDQFESSIGQVLFYFGMAGNLYHHYLLTTLRSSNTNEASSKKYVAPRGGLFEYVAAPHYLFELITWLGIAVVSQNLTAYLNLLSMSSYLFARSRNQNQWNRTKFDESEWPASRKNLIPFLY